MNFVFVVLIKKIADVHFACHAICFHVSEECLRGWGRVLHVRRNPLSRAIAVFSGQKLGSRIILSILLYFVHFQKAKNINSCLK